MGSTDDILLGFWTPDHGWSAPTGSTNAMAVGARQLGCEIARHTLVTAVDQPPDGRWRVTTDKGEVTCDHVVNAAGHYSPQLGAMSGIDVPIVSMIHQYLITESLPEMAAQEEALSRGLQALSARLTVPLWVSSFALVLALIAIVIAVVS